MKQKVAVHDLYGKVVGDVELSDLVFRAPIRKDIITRVVLWQLAKRRSGNHKTKEIGDVSGTTRKPFRQKGTGKARQGSLRSPQFRGGAVIFGPVVRSHAYSLQKKVRRFGLRSILSARLAEGKLTVVDQLSLKEGKTKEISSFLKGSVLMIGGESVCQGLQRAVSNIPKVDLLPQQGINVYDVLRHDHLILSREALEYLEARLAL